MSLKGDPIRVSANSRPSLVAGSIAKAIRAHQTAEMQAIGAPAVHQAVKALAIAVTYLRKDGISIGFVPEFNSGVVEGGQTLTAIRFLIRIIEVPPG
jgi:stage V sporulation protein S